VGLVEKAASLIVTEALVGIDDECGAGIHVDIFEADIAIEDEGGIFGNETPGAGSGHAAQGVW
jgi:hypothetical protein